MLRRIRVQWFRFTHGEDIFDAWPGEQAVRVHAAPRPADVAVLQPAA